ncbi:hypothetical protein [Shewanella indica]|uniref:hypothetical protein n=1 Tax=Shewanella indica TaxID=768528 RepID=UPI003006F2A0
MDAVCQLKANTSDGGSGVVFWGGVHIGFPWPVNPLGKELALVFMIDCSVLNYKVVKKYSLRVKYYQYFQHAQTIDDF